VRAETPWRVDTFESPSTIDHHYPSRQWSTSDRVVSQESLRVSTAIQWPPCWRFNSRIAASENVRRISGVNTRRGGSSAGLVMARIVVEAEDENLNHHPEHDGRHGVEAECGTEEQGAEEKPNAMHVDEYRAGRERAPLPGNLWAAGNESPRVQAHLRLAQGCDLRQTQVLQIALMHCPFGPLTAALMARTFGPEKMTPRRGNARGHDDGEESRRRGVHRTRSAVLERRERKAPVHLTINDHATLDAVASSLRAQDPDSPALRLMYADMARDMAGLADDERTSGTPRRDT